MRKKLLAVVSLLLAVVLFSACSAAPKTVMVKMVNPSEKKEVTVVSNAGSKSNKAYEARFLNMLNRNYVYDNSFASDDELINSSIIAILNLRDSQDDSYINEMYVKDFVFNMYGKIYNDLGFLNAEFPQREGFVYIIPRGYTQYTHKIVSVTDNLDGSYTVVTDISCEAHDGEAENLTATTLFIKNSESAFGFNILYSEISEYSSNTATC